MPASRPARSPHGARILLACAALISAPSDWAADTWQRGNISEVTTTARGLMIRLVSGLPTTCTGTGLGWMLIPEANKTMLSTALLLWITGRRTIDVYTAAPAAVERHVAAERSTARRMPSFYADQEKRTRLSEWDRAPVCDA